MSKKILLVLITLLTVALAGCHEQAGEPDDGTGDTGDDGDGGDGDAMVPNVTFSNIDAPDTVAAGEAFDVTYDVAVDGTHTTNHIGAHWSTASTAQDTDLAPGDFAGASPHNTTGVQLPTTHTIRDWNFTAAGTYYFRPHLQLVIEGTVHNFWGAEQTIVVTE